MSEEMRQHHDLAMDKKVDTGAPKHSATGGTRNPDTDAAEAGAGHVHKTEPSRDAGHQHGNHEHHHMHHFHPKDHRGGHVHMHEHHPKEHDGGHGGHKHHGRKKNF